MTHVAPAARLLTVVHELDPARPGDTPATTVLESSRVATLPKRAHTGWTRCGQSLLVEETWIEVPADVAPVCDRCAGGVEEPDLFGGGGL